MHNELQEESDHQPQHSLKLDPEQQKNYLISTNTQFLRRLLRISLTFAIVRIFLFILVIEFQELLIVNQKGKGYADSWNVIFYVVACLMDFLGSINDVAMLKFLNSEEERLVEVKKQILEKSAVTTQTKAGSYELYLSIFSLLKRYKYSPLKGISISQTVRTLHLIMTIYIFGNMALQSQGQVDGDSVKIAFFWVYLLSIIFNVYELDLCVFQSSDGMYLQKDDSVVHQPGRNGEQSEVLRSVKDRFIKGARFPFQVFYLINILIMLGMIMFYFRQSFFTLMLIICISAHILELLHQKHLQNKLMGTDLIRLPYKYLNPFKIMNHLIRNQRKTYIIIRSLTRMTIFMTVFAYFRDVDTPIIQSFCFWILNIGFVMEQIAKFNRLEQEKLYRIAECPHNSFQQKQCAICLLTCQNSEQIVQLPCFADHIFHKKCMQNWLVQRRQCPLCRFSLQMYELK